MAIATQRPAVVPAELRGLRPAGNYTFDELYRFAQMCHASGLFEDVADAAQAMIKIVKGQELGLPPTTAMAGFDLIKKRLFIKPWIIAAQINACGYGGYKILEQTDQVCTIQFTKKYAGEGWKVCPPVRYTFAEAEAHGLVNRSPHWKASPAHMLYQRAMGRGGAMYFPELLAGLQPPQDDTPITEEQHAGNIRDLFGDDPRGSTPTVPVEAIKSVTPEPLPAENRQETTQQPQGATQGAQPSAWRDTLTAHREQLAGMADRSQASSPLRPLLGQVDAALGDLAYQESQGFTLAGQVLDALYDGAQPAQLHPIWARIAQWYTEAARAEQYAAYQAWACKRYRVATVAQIGEQDLEEMAAKVYATLEPLIVARQQREEDPRANAHAAVSDALGTTDTPRGDVQDQDGSQGASWGPESPNLFEAEEAFAKQKDATED